MYVCTKFVVLYVYGKELVKENEEKEEKGEEKKDKGKDFAWSHHMIIFYHHYMQYFHNKLPRQLNSSQHHQTSLYVICNDSLDHNNNKGNNGEKPFNILLRSFSPSTFHYSLFPIILSTWKLSSMVTSSPPRLSFQSKFCDPTCEKMMKVESREDEQDERE